MASLPIIDNLAALSDHFTAINDPALRAAEASKISGKSHADMMPFRLSGRRCNTRTDGISDNLASARRGGATGKGI